uniref:site-specific integrase n=1 Tax=Polynucleobacter sp. TaxID=2029855 RepID=UPI004048E4F1
MASITIRNGSYRVRITRQGQSTISKSFKTEFDALKWVRQVEVQLELGIYQEQTKKRLVKQDISFTEAAGRYISTHVAHKLNHRTEAGILGLISKRWESRKLSSIQKQDVLMLKEDLLKSGRAASTVNHYINAISQLYQVAVNEWEFKLTNPTTGIKRMSEPQGRMKRLLPDAENILLGYATESTPLPLSSIIIIAVETGMRSAEILSMRWEDVDLINRRVLLRHTKNGESRVVPLTSRAKNELEKLTSRYESELVFPYCRWQIRRQYIKAVAKAKSAHKGVQNPFIGLRFHDLRHEALSRLSDKGLNVIELAHISGHRTLSMLRRYTHPNHETLLNKLDK